MARRNKSSEESLVEFSQFHTKWDTSSTENTVDNINLKFEVGEKGSLEVNGKFSYAAQEPWLFTGTVWVNIGQSSLSHSG